MKPTPYDDLWRDKANWKWGLLYYCKKDPRVIVPKKPAWMGRTLNFAQPKSYMVLLLTILAVSAPWALILRINNAAWVVLYLAVVACVIVFYYTADIRA